MLKVLFLCSGNACRSQMAEGLVNHDLDGLVKAFSAGIQPSQVFGPGADSGTFDFFTEAVVGQARSSRKDYTGSEDDNILVQGVAMDKNALGLFWFRLLRSKQGQIEGCGHFSRCWTSGFPLTGNGY